MVSVTRAARSGANWRAWDHVVACCALLAAGLPAAAFAAPGPTTGKNAPRGGATSRPPTARGGITTPVEESLSQRRAVRGVPVDEEVESPELAELRRFEEQAFPHAGLAPMRGANADTVDEPPPQLPGRWEGTGDVPEAIRAPETTPTPPFTRAPPVPDSDWLRSLKLPELPVRWDPQVLRYLDYFKNDPRGRSVMSNWLRRAGRFRSLYDAVLDRNGLPRDLFYVAMVESGFETAARSPVGAGGVWQFMPGAARAYGLEVGYWIDARRDPERSVEAAARYLKDLYVRFGSWHLVFAAYNAGYGAVLKSITRYNTNDYWELCHHEAGLPWESSLYVPKILAAAIVGHNLGAFGYADIVADPPFVYDKVVVLPGTGLATVARATKTKSEVIAALNPEIMRDRTPPDRPSYELRVPAGSAALFAEGFERSRAASDRLETVTLRFGETLEDVAKARGVSTRELRRLNGVKDTGELRAGVAIVVPPAANVGSKTGGKAAGKGGDKAGSGATAATASGDGAPGLSALASSGDRDGSTGSSPNPDDDEILVAVPDRVFNYEGRERVFYRTRDGDSLDDIAEAVGVRPDDLVEWNNLDATAKLHPRMVLQIFVRKDFDPTQVVLLDPARVRVVTLGSQEFLELEAARRGKKRLVIEAKAGDTLVRIGRRYGLTIGDLARINRFSYNTDLQSGQKVVVYSPVGEGPREIAHGMSPDARRERKVVSLGRGGAGKTGDKTGDKAGYKGGDKIGSRAGGKTEGKTDARTDRAGVRTTDRTPSREKVVALGGVKPPSSGGSATGGGRGHDRTDEKFTARTAAKAPVQKPAAKKK